MSGFSLDGVTLLFPTVGTRRSQGIGGGGVRVQGLSVSSGPSDSSLWADGGASGAAPVAEAAAGLAADRRGRRGRRGHRGRRGRRAGASAGTGAAPGSWRAAVLVAASEYLEEVWVEAASGCCSVCARYKS